MAKLKLRGKDLVGIGYSEGRPIGLAIDIMLKHYRTDSRESVLALLKDVLENQERYAEHEVLGPIVAAIRHKKAMHQEISLEATPLPYRSFGADGIEAGAIRQMDMAMRLPVAVAGALMPDAHQGYGLPIGGVLAVENAVIPYGVGVDIGCRMCLTVYGLPPHFLEKNRASLKDLLIENTRFGFDTFEKPMDDEVLDRPEFREIPKLRELKQKAREQIGSSGSGNHFVDFGIVELPDDSNEFSLPAGQYMGVLSHSGSRGLGASIAKHYTKIAMETCLLPKEAKHLAWLSLDSEAGEEYWLAMNLSGDYASACHNHLHHRLAQALGEAPVMKVENHHNFAWKEFLPDGREVVVHRKGATPAGYGALGIIPGSMTSPGFIVRGKGEPSALASASHGAGRLLSRRKAKEQIKFSDMKRLLKTHKVDLIGGGLDEAPFAYKDIHQVMEYQRCLVEVLGSFYPKIVRMDHH